MSDVQLTTRRQLELMHHLQQLADARAAEELRLAKTLSEVTMAAEKDHQLTANRLTREFNERRRVLENEFAEAKRAAGREHHDAQHELQEGFDRQQHQLADRHQQTLLAIESKFKEKQWEALAVYDASKDKPQQTLDQANKRILARKTQVDSLERDAATLLAMRRMKPPEEDATHSERPTPVVLGSSQTAEERQQHALMELHRGVLDLQAQKLPALLLEENRFLIWGGLAILAGFAVVLPISGFALLFSAVAGPILGALLTALVYLGLGPRARRHSLGQYNRVRAVLERCRHWETKAREESQYRCRQESEAVVAAKDQGLAEAERLRGQAVAAAETRQKETHQQAQREAEIRLAEIDQRHNETLAAIEEKYPPLLADLATARQAAWDQNENRYAETLKNAQSEHDRDWQVMSDTWLNGFRKIRDELSAMKEVCGRYFPDWTQTQWDGWQRPDSVPPVVQFGHCVLPLQAVKHGVSQEPRLVPAETQLDLPAWVSFSENPRLVITTGESGRQTAVQVLQLMMLRFLTALPAGKLRFTIIDPAALGENFATFMHLADYDEQLVGKRILTDSRQIDERLALVSDHMEKVLQKYLRNEFPTIQEYNAHAGEVAEPYHVVVVANFPVGLSDNATRRIKTIAATGPRCGVFTIMSVDTSIKLPNEFPMSELLSGSVHLDWTGERLRWKYPLFEKLALELDQLPPKDTLNEVLRHAGQESRTASKVEVPFTVVAPQPDAMWSLSTAEELVVPVGRAGANELQSLRLGKGTAQHALVSGKTGSGKSTLLHALVTNLALYYSPREVEFYLVDFKKGVEFKTYATHQLPHARVIAIESEREFGVSVLERLDQELQRRGEFFRTLGVQDLGNYRRESGEILSRILLIVDEFQELFVADDKLAQDAALLLDRLVRQGRAFGIHVLLGSQTLAGAYSLARSTIGQMAVRIALECSEADAHLILSDDNPAARLLSRPGEAIYNDQNGMVEGNHLFQVVWLPERERQKYLADIRSRQQAEGIVVEPAIVFEGNVPANPLQNESLLAMFDTDRSKYSVEPTIWLGSAVRIEPPTNMVFRRQGGNNFLVVGQDEPLALGILTTAAATLAAQMRGSEPQIVVLDGMRAESPDVGTWKRLADVLGCQVEAAPVRDTARVIARIAEEVARRSAEPELEHEPLFLVVYDLAQFRDLRISEDEFSFSVRADKDKPAASDKQFREILKEGPAVGVHVLMWSDSHNSLTRVLDRLTLREVDYRIALQMSPVDSTSLIDTPAAGRLGEHRALFYRDDLGTTTKFRPYGRPSDEWLRWLAEHRRRVQAETIADFGLRNAD